MKSTVSEKGQVTIPKRKGPGRVVDRFFGILPHVDVDKEIERFRGKPWNRREDGPLVSR